jgi:hypothetical protein
MEAHLLIATLSLCVGSVRNGRGELREALSMRAGGWGHPGYRGTANSFLFPGIFATFEQILYLNPLKLFMKKNMLPNESARRLKRLRIFICESHIGNLFEDA